MRPTTRRSGASPSAGSGRTFSPTTDVAGRGQHGVAAVEVQQHEPARRTAEVHDLRDRLLAPVAALAQVDGAAQPVELVRERLLVDLGREAGAATPRSGAPRAASDARDGRATGATRLRRARPARRAARSRSIQCHSDAGWLGSRAYRCRSAARRPRVGPVDARRPGRAPAPRIERRRRHRADDGVARPSVGDLDAQHEPHAVEQGGERRGLGALDDEPGASRRRRRGARRARCGRMRRGTAPRRTRRARAGRAPGSPWSAASVSRSGPVTVTHAAVERSTMARPRSRRRCSTIGLP